MKTMSGTSMMMELLVRAILIIIFFYTDKAMPYFRKIQKEEYWLYSFPRTPSYYPSNYLWATVALGPFLIIGLVYRYTRDKVDAIQAVLGVYFSLFLAGSVTNCIKMGVGRPRPDFLARCFPDGKIDDSMACTGKMEDVIDGYKSFPSGHSSMSFSCLAFLAWYIAGKLHVFNAKGRGSAWRLTCFVLMLLWPTMIAVSRTADFHHHWQDVTIGGLLGLGISYMVYRMYYPPLQRLNSHLPYVLLDHTDDRQISSIDTPVSPGLLGTPTYAPNIEQLLKTV